MSNRPKDAVDSTRDNPPVLSQNSSSHGGQQIHSQQESPSLVSVSSPHPNSMYSGRKHERPFELPPLPITSSATLKGPPPTRLAGVSSILNPTPPAQSFAKDSRSRVTGPELNNISLSAPGKRSPPASFGPALPRPAPAVPGQPASQEVNARQILTPKSPAATLHRATSLGHVKVNSRETGFQQPPFTVSPHPRPYPTEPGRLGPFAQPMPALENRRSYGASGVPSGEVSDRSNIGPVRMMGITPNSSSPSTPFPSYSQTIDTSPTSQPAQIPSMFHASGRAAPPTPIMNTLDMARSYGSEPADTRHQRVVGIPISSSGGQNVYQMMTLETTSGRVQLPVDVQAASRVADEKRRRNAGASARFRQRRKEKEKEASSTISRLEQQVKELGEEVDFYRHERDYFASVLGQIPGGERHLARATSPRRRRSPSTGASSSTSAYHGIHDLDPHNVEDGRHARRRASTLSLGAHNNSIPGHGQSTSYRPGYGSAFTYGSRPQSPPTNAQYFAPAHSENVSHHQATPHQPGTMARPAMATSPSGNSGMQNTGWGQHHAERLPPIAGPRDHAVSRNG